MSVFQQIKSRFEYQDGESGVALRAAAAPIGDNRSLLMNDDSFQARPLQTPVLSSQATDSRKVQQLYNAPQFTATNDRSAASMGYDTPSFYKQMVQNQK